MVEPLNLLLYGLLKRHFGEVKVQDPGVKMRARYSQSLWADGPRLDVSHPGEYYRVCCDKCGDTRFRLYINHRWGHRDDQGRRNLFLIYCFNEHCYSDYEAKKDLFEALTELPSSLENARIREGKEAPLEPGVVAWPGPVTRVDRLPDHHPANSYLISRFFDPQKIGRVYGATYCEDSHFYVARKRLIIPVYQDGAKRAWLGRYLGELDWTNKNNPPKYFNLPGMPRNQLLYNFDQAKKYETGIICEGVTDVWSLGGMGVCIFGNTMSFNQQKRFVNAFYRKTAVLLLDPQEKESRATKALITTLRREIGAKRFCAVWLPKGTDPGSLEREWLRDFISAQAGKKGVKVTYKKRG